MTTSSLRTLLLSGAFVTCAVLATPGHAQSTAVPATVMQAYQELFQVSLKEKRGLMFYVRGQAIGGAVTKVLGNDGVEIRNNTYGRIVIRLDQVDGVAIN